MSTPPVYDAAPLAGGAGVNESNFHNQFTRLIPPAHHNAPVGTSNVAAHRIAGYAPTQRDCILAFIESRGATGATDDEGESALSIKCQTYTPRRGELVALGLVRDSGHRRETASGRPAAVWVTPAHAPLREGGAK